MSDDDLRIAVEEFLASAEDVYEEYERGYVDADAALGVLESHVESLRDVVENAEQGGD